MDPRPRKPLLQVRHVAPLAVGLVPLITVLLVLLGPAPSVPLTSATLAPALLSDSLHEPTDRAVFVVWVLVALALAVGVTVRVGARVASRLRVRSQLLIWVVGPGLFLLLAGLLYESDPYGVVPDLGLTAFAIGVLMAISLVFVTSTYVASRSLINGLMVTAVLAVVAPVWLQLPGRMPDLGNAQFTLSEIAAVGAGSTPLVDFFPQYTQLLGYPIAPPLRLFAEHAATIALGWVLMLQAVTLVIAVLVAARAGGRRFVGPAALLVPSMAFMAADNQYSSFTYFAGNPLRTVLPVIVIGAAVAFLARPLTESRPVHLVVVISALGALAGLAALNNPDYGVPVVLATWLVALAAGSSRVVRWATGVLFPIAVGIPFLAYWVVVGLWRGSFPVLGDWLLFPSVFGREGYFNAPMRALGWHVAGATLFVAAAAIGFALLASSRGTGRRRRRQIGLTLALVGTWSVLTLPYFMGRSLPSTFLGGYALQVGWVVACLFPLVVIGFRTRRWERRASPSRWAQLSLWLGLSATATVASMWTLVASQDAFSRDPAGPIGAVTSAGLRDALSRAPIEVRRAVNSGGGAQIVTTSPFVAAEVGIRSAAAFSDPSYLGMSTSFAWRQCRRLRNEPARYIITLATSMPALQAVPECREVLDFARAVPLADLTGVVPAGFQVMPRPFPGSPSVG